MDSKYWSKVVAPTSESIHADYNLSQDVIQLHQAPLKTIIATVIMPQQQQNLIHHTKKQQIPQTHLTQKPKTSVVTEKHKQIELKQAQTATSQHICDNTQGR